MRRPDSTRRFWPKRSWAVAAAAAALPLVGPISVGAAPTIGAIDMTLLAPPSIEGDLTLQLVLDGDDLTASHCVTGVSEGGGAHPMLSCDSLPEGTYDVEVSGVPAGAQTHVTCVDIVAARAERPIIGNGYEAWSCDLWVAPPAVLLGLDAEYPDDEGLITAPDMILRDGGGNDITPGCEPDVIRGLDRSWCQPLPFGEYSVDLANVPDGYRSAVGCWPIAGSVGPEAATDQFDLTPEGWLWSCSYVSVVPPLIIVVFVSDVADYTWLRDVVPTVVDQDDVDVTDLCSLSTEFIEPGDYGFVEFDCLGLADGVYDVSVAGIPEGLTVANNCEATPIPDTTPDGPGAICSINAFDDSFQPPDPDPTTPSTVDDGDLVTTTGPVATLPSTGRPGATGLGMIGAFVLVLGVVLTMIASRRSAGLD